MQGVKSPRLGDVNHPRVLLPEGFVIPQPHHPHSNQHQRDDERVEEEEPVAVQHQSFALLVHHQSHHGEESEDVEDEDLPLGHEVPVIEAARPCQQQRRHWHPALILVGCEAAGEVYEEDQEEGDVPHRVTQILVVVIQQLKGINQRLWLQVPDDGVLPDGQVVLIPTEDEAVVDGVPHQVDAGAHDECDDADVHHGSWQRLWGALDEL